MLKQEFMDAMDRARPGQGVVYHSGLLMNDRLFNREADKTARAAWSAYTKGWCVLVQRRIPDASPSAVEYVAVKQ